MTRKAAAKSALGAQIVSSLGNPISTKELLARLLNIADALSAVDQEHAVLDEYRDLAKNLANIKLIKHKNTGIQAFAACAIADILRLFAPDAPFAPEELSNIFQAFAAQFSHLWDEENPYFIQQSYILKRIVEVRSVVLIGDLPDSQKLVSLLFDTMYNVTTKGFPLKLEHLASEMLAETILETDLIPQEVVSLIIKRLTVSADSQLMGVSSNISNPAFVFSLAICEANTNKMARLVAQLFSEMLDESAKLSHKQDRDAPFKALEKIHQSSVQIWAHVPDILGSVMGLISDELNSDDESIRSLATKTIGSMLSSSSRANTGNSAVTFVSCHRDTWTNWLKKSSDHSSSVRSTWVEQLPEILAPETTTEINTQLSLGLSKCLIDSSEKVRYCTCKAIESLPFSVTLKKVYKTSILKSLFLLIREKHADTRNTAISLLADLYNNCMISKAKNEIIDLGNMDLEIYDEVIALIVNGVPNNLLQLNYINDKSITAAVDIALFEKLLPFEDSAQLRVYRLCHFVKSLEEKNLLAFTAITKRQKKIVEVILKFLDLAEEYASTYPTEKENKENLLLTTQERFFTQVDRIVAWLSSPIPDGLNTYECIDAFFKLKNMRFINLLKNCMNSQLDYKTVKNSAKELLSKLSDVKSIKGAKGSSQVTTADMVSNFKILLYRSSTILYNKSNIGEIIKISQDANSDIQSAANKLISMISTNSPGAFKTHFAVLANLAVTESPSLVKVSLLQSLYHILAKLPECFPDDDSFLQRICVLAAEGSHLQAKYCLKTIGCSPSKEWLVSEILTSILPLNPENNQFGTHLSVLAEIYLVDPFSLTSHSSEINSTIVEEVLRKNKLAPSDVAVANGVNWVDDSQLDKHRALVEKLMSIRLIANKLRFIASSKSTDSATLSAAEKPINLLANIVSNNGEIVKSSADASVIATPSCYKLRLKLMAGLMLLKLAKYPRLNPLMRLDVIKRLPHLLLDERIQVREVFLKALQNNLQDRKISERFLHLVFFMGHEPDLQLRRAIDTWVLSQHNRMELKNDTLYERTSVRLIHSLAHESRFCKLITDPSKEQSERELEAYVYILGYFAMFINTVVKEKNISLLYYLASRVKQYRDNVVEISLYNLSDVPPQVLNLYRVAELVQLMLKELADSKSWNLQTWPGKINLPTDLFSPMEDYHQAQEFVSRVYISDLIQVELREILSSQCTTGAKRKPNDSRKPQSIKKAKLAIHPKKQSSKRAAIKPRAQTKAEKPKSKPLNASAARRSRRLATKVYYGESEEEKAEENESENSNSYGYELD